MLSWIAGTLSAIASLLKLGEFLGPRISRWRNRKTLEPLIGVELYQEDEIEAAITWIRRENGVSGLKRLQLGGPGEYRFCEAFYHR